jgi:peptidoglycan/LPS O-acetylase OafA/YrhL
MPALTSLRFLAAAVVLLHHFPPANPSWPLAVVASQGHVGVTVFFVLSGFLITMRYSNALGGPHGVTLNEYFRKRVARIVPLYWTVLGVSLALSIGGLEFSSRTLPEWVLLQGYLSRGIGDLAVPTSWTLTLEESFYVTAPLLFLWLRRARAFGAWVLLACTLALLSGGLALGHVVDPERFQFLGSAEELFRHTFFGRFVDFALGVWGGRLFLSGRVTQAWARPRGHLAAAAAGVAGVVLVFAGQAGMTLAGGLDSPRWVFAWPFNLIVGVGSLVLILSLTSSLSPLSRLLGAAPLVYLGRVSYALYVVQLTPLGKGVLYRLIPSGTPGFGLLLYAGMTLISALLFELVEEPGRRFVMRVWPRGRERGSRAHGFEEGRRVREAPAWALVLVVSLVALVQAGALAGARLAPRPPPPTLAESQGAATSLADRIVALPVHRLESRVVAQGTWHRIPIPEAWMIGTANDRRAPPSLLVYADGQPIPFERRVAGVPASPASAYLRGPRTTFVELQMPDDALPSEVTLLRHDPLFAGMLFARRIAASPPLLGVILFASAAAVAAAGLSFRGWRPGFRASAALALTACTVFILADLHAQPWAPALMAAELIALCTVARIKRRPTAAHPAAA